jgi:isopenicillin N synthase-like dioxygenase
MIGCCLGRDSVSANFTDPVIQSSNYLMNNTTPIPIINFVSGSTDSASQQQVAQQIQQACQTFGFFYLTNYNLPAAQIEQTFAEAKAFFALPLAVKKQVLRSPQTNCGYVPLGVERLNPQRAGDLKEAFNIGVKTCWPSEPNQFRCVVERFYQDCITQVALPLLQTLALSLHLPESFFVQRHGQNFFLRLLHYPALTDSPLANQLRAGEHTDYGTITLLFQDASQTGGLEIRSRQGNWLPAPALAETILVNIGDALQRWTNDHWHSTPHRVVLPADHGAIGAKSRYSMALFCDPDPEVEIACLDSCQSQPPRYPPIQYQDYLQSRFAATY